MRETYFTTVVQGSTLDEIREQATREIKRFFGQALPFAVDIDPHLTKSTVDGNLSVLQYEAIIRCRGFTV